MELSHLTPTLCPSSPCAESDFSFLAQQHEMEQVMEKLQQINQSLELMLTAMESAQKQLEKHLQHIHDVLNPTSELGWVMEGRWLIVGTDVRLLLLDLQVGAQVSSPPASTMYPTLSCLWHYWCPRSPVPSSSSCSSPSAPSVCSLASQRSQLVWPSLWQVGIGVGEPG